MSVKTEIARINNTVNNQSDSLDEILTTLTGESGDGGAVSLDNNTAKINSIRTKVNNLPDPNNVYYVKLEGDFPNYGLSEETPIADIKAAYDDNKALFCRGYVEGNFTIELPLLSAFSSGSIFIFSGSHCVDNTGVLPENAMITIAVVESGVYCEYQEYLTKADAIVTSVSSSSTDEQVASAKCLYDLVGNVTAQIDAM